MLGRRESALRQGFRLGENACTAQTRRRPEGRLGRPSDPWIWGNFRAILLEKVAVLHFQRKVV